MPAFTLQIATKDVYNLTEGPFWDETKGVLYFVDMFAGDVYKLDPKDKSTEKNHFDGEATAVIPIYNKEDEFIISQTKKISNFNWRTKEMKLLGEIEANNDKTRLNDGKCDPKGRLWIGSMGLETSPLVFPPELGALYRVDGENKISKHFSEVTLSNGLAWSNDSKILYFADSMKKIIHAFDYDNQSGDISNERIVYDYTKNPEVKPKEFPDGMTIDLNGKLWVANYNGGRIFNIDPETGATIDKIDLPATCITSLCFGGPNLNEFFITSAYKGLSDEERANEPHAGAVFRVTLDGQNIRGALNQRFIYQ